MPASLLQRPTLLGLGPAGRPVANESVVRAIGDSITANGYVAPNTTDGPKYGGQSYLQRASQLSGGKFRIGGVAATSGYTSTQVLTTHLPTVLAAKPRYCIVLCGTNDVPIGSSTTKANLLAIWNALANAGITPILATLTPATTTPARTSTRSRI
jgi:lysophospholipase L1-like esterase